MKEETKTNIYKKLEMIREEIRLKKDGKNDFQKYNYFTPDNIIGTVNPVLKKHNVIALFNMEWSNDIYVATLKILDIETAESIVFRFDIKLGIVKGANESQASGSTLTYGKRYSYMNAFDIVDNKDDLDSNDIAEKKEKEEKKELAKKLEKVAFDKKELAKCNSEQDLTNYYNRLKPEFQKDKEILKQFTERKETINGKH